MDNTWSDLQPDDGFLASLHQISDVKAWLTLSVSLNGEIQQCKQVASVDWPTPKQIGNLKRKLIVLEAVAEYLNAGGDPAELPELTSGITSTLSVPGWDYYDTGVNGNGNRVHEFVNADLRFTRWVRGEYIDVDLSLEEVTDDTTRATGTPADSDHINFDGFEATDQTHLQLE